MSGLGPEERAHRRVVTEHIPEADIDRVLAEYVQEEYDMDLTRIEAAEETRQFWRGTGFALIPCLLVWGIVITAVVISAAAR